jgi:dipeptidyl aminopeptidase/acylaminoacyl peptidase
VIRRARFYAVAAAAFAAVVVGRAQDSREREPAPVTRPAEAASSVSRPAESRPSAETRPVEALEIEDALRARLAEPMARLDLDLAMFGDDFFGERPSDVRFTDDGARVVFSWRRPGEKRTGTFVYDLAARTLVRLADSDAGPRRGVRDRAGKRRLAIKGRAVVLENVDGSSSVELGRFPQAPSGATFSADEQAAFVAVGASIWRLPTAAPGARALLTFADGRRIDRAAPPPTDSRAERLREEFTARERALFRTLFEREERAKAETRPKHADEAEVPSYAAPDGFEIGGPTISPRGDFVAFSLSKPASVRPREDRVPHFITKDGYLETPDARAKAGDALDEARTVFVAMADGKSVDLRLPADPPRLSARGVFWSDDGAHCVVEARSFDRSSRLILRVDPATGETSVLARDDDAAWVLGSGLGFVPGSSSYAYLSERTGFRALHVVDVATGATRLIGSGGYEINAPWFSPDGSYALAVAAPNTPHTREIVRFDLATGEAQPLTADGGLREIVVSPDGSTVAEVHSYAARPWELFVRTRDAFDRPVRVTESPSPAFASYRWRSPPIVRVESEGGSFPARLYEPASGGRGGPGVVFIHGAGYLQNVHDGWSQYPREYAFHHVLAERGYTVLDIDYRGSAGYGRDFRAAVKGRIGDLDAFDVVAAARHLVAREGCDPRRIHCYGGSYGGFLTLMALFKHPGVFCSGAALRPVTDWSHYHEGYTANLLDDPLDDVAVYRAASPITFAAGLADRLLVCHGLVDDNVLPHDSIRLAQRLIELRKTDFEVMLYPWEPHGFVDAASWSDEYRRIFELFERPPRTR